MIGQTNNRDYYFKYVDNCLSLLKVKRIKISKEETLGGYIFIKIIFPSLKIIFPPLC